METKIRREGLKQIKVSCPGCGNNEYIFVDDKDKIVRVMGSSIIHKSSVLYGTIECPECKAIYDILK